MSYQRVKYKLINNDTNISIWLEHDPINWDSSEKTLKRSTKTFGVYTELSKDLVFVKDGAKFLKDAYLFKDIEANIELYEYRFHPETSHPYLHSQGTFDFSGYKATRTEVKVPFKSGGLNALIKSQIREKFELERLEAINGNVIDEVIKKDVALTSRKILLVSQLEGTLENTDAFGFSGQFRTIPMEVVSNGDAENIVYVVGDDFVQWTLDGSFGGDDLNPNQAQYFYLDSDVAKTIEIDFYLDATLNTVLGSALDVYILHRDIDDNTTELRKIFNSDYGNQFNYVVDYKGLFDLEEGDSLMIVLGAIGNTANSGLVSIQYNATPKLTVTEDSIRPDSQTKAVLMHDIGDKLMQIITGEQGRYYSEYFGLEDLGYEADGEFARLALTLGFWIRQFYYETEIVDGIETTKNAMEISLDQFLNTTRATNLTGYGIETMNGVETLVHEDLKYFFQDAVAINLTNQVTDLEYSSAKAFCYSSLLFGYKKGGEYDEAMGLDEYNVRSGFTLPITRVDTTYKAESDARADKYGQEFARRKSKTDYPTTDTAYDKDLHLLDLKNGLGLALEERDFNDDFDELPKNIYSPETATNLRLTPSAIEERHEWFYGACLTKQQDKKVRYANGDGNKSLITKKNGVSRAEKDDLEISELAKPRFVAKWATFEHPINYEINQQINGTTNVNGREIPNVYFKVQFIDDEGKKKQGYLFEQKKQGADLGKFKLLMTN